MREHLKFKQLLNQFRSLKFEEEYIKDFLMEADSEFEDAFQSYLEKNELSEDDLNRPPPQQLEVVEEDDESICESSTEPLELKHFKKAHRKLVKILHPDRQSANDPRRQEHEEDFKKLTKALNDNLWAEFFEIADKYNVELDRVEEANRLLLEDIEKASETIEGKKKTFSWFLSQCGDSEDCRDNVIEVYLRSKFGWTKDK